MCREDQTVSEEKKKLHRKRDRNKRKKNYNNFINNNNVKVNQKKKERKKNTNDISFLFNIVFVFIFFCFSLSFFLHQPANSFFFRLRYKNVQCFGFSLLVMRCEILLVYLQQMIDCNQIEYFCFVLFWFQWTMRDWKKVIFIDTN